MTTKVVILPPLEYVKMIDGHEGKRVYVATVTLFSVQKAVAARLPE